MFRLISNIFHKIIGYFNRNLEHRILLHSNYSCHLEVLNRQVRGRAIAWRTTKNPPLEHTLCSLPMK